MPPQNSQKGDGAVWTVPLADVAVDDELAAAVEKTLRSGWWSSGPQVEAFESACAEYLGSRFALAVASGTAALHLALLAARVGPGDEVVLPSLNFVAAANAVSHTGAVPVFCDVGGEDDLNLDPDSFEAAVTPATKALLLLHYGGYPCDVDAVAEIADRHGLLVIEDSAHAPGASIRGRSCGTFGLAGCFSFFSNKNLPIGEGGLLVTDDADLHGRARLLRSHGMTTLTWDRHRGHAADYDVTARGFNFRLDEVRATIGLVQLERLAAENKARKRIVACYRSRLADTSLVLPFAAHTEDVQPSFHLAVVVFPSPERRDAARQLLAERRIQTSLHYPPIHRFSAYSPEPLRVPLPVTEDVTSRLLTIPLFGHMRDEQVELVAGALTEADRAA